MNDGFDNKYVDFLKYLEREFSLNSIQAVELSFVILETIPVLISENQILKDLFATNVRYIKQNEEID
ncbi:MAG: hypothetical protein WBF90_12590 [Rivularia sp. (in: cyanobacteria)]